MTLLPIINVTCCDGCGYCVTQCPTGALGLVEDKAALLYPQRCTGDAACEEICPGGAIALPYQVVFATSQGRNYPARYPLAADL